MNNPQQNNLPQQNNDEIDLFELVATLWRGKWLIVGVTFVCTVIAVISTLFITRTPVYKASIVISPPTIEQIAPVNTNLLYKLNPKEEIFIAISNSNSNNLYPSSLTKEQIFREALNTLKFSPAELQSDKSDNYTLSILGQTADEALTNLQNTLDASNKSTSENIQSQRNAETEIIVKNITNTLTTLRNNLDKAQKIKIQQLNNALTIAKKLNITQPILPISEPYMQGTEALTAQIQLLESDKAFYTNDPQYNELSSMLEYYQSIQNHQLPELMTFNLLQKPTVSLEPIKPNKKLITIIGFLIGGMLGCMIVLIRQAVRNRKI